MLHFGCGRWKFIEISVWDKDNNGDDNLMPTKYYLVCNAGRCSLTYANSGSKLNFDIELIPDQNECSPNPCHNGGTCSDGSCGFLCFCPPGYHGPKCEHIDPCTASGPIPSDSDPNGPISLC